MRNKILSLLSVLSGITGINVVYALIQAVRSKNAEARQNLMASLASSLLVKQGNLPAVISAYSAVKEEWVKEWARLRTQLGKGQPAWLPRALAEVSVECGFYTTLLVHLREVNEAGFMPIQGVLESTPTTEKGSYDRRVAEDFKAAWKAGLTKFEG
jgi:hypothetical protein